MTKNYCCSRRCNEDFCPMNRPRKVEPIDWKHIPKWVRERCVKMQVLYHGGG